MKQLLLAFAFGFLYVSTSPSAEPVKPEIAGAQGKRAFDDLARYYEDPKKLPPFADALDALKGDNAKGRTDAGAYLLALLKQSWADETNGRAPLWQTPFLGGGTVSAAREFRAQLAEDFAKQAQGEAALDAAIWLLETERLAENQVAGLTALRHIQGAKANAAFKSLIAPPHPNADVATGAVEEVGERKLKELSKEVVALCGHHRTALREAARKAADRLDLKVSAYDPEKAFTPRLEKQLTDITALVQVAIPKDARWVVYTTKGSPHGSIEPSIFVTSGWLLGTEKKQNYRIVNWFGEEVPVGSLSAVKDSTLADAAAELRKLRTGSSVEALDKLYRGDMQFQPRFISQPEILVGAWAFVRGDRKTAATILFERIDQIQDDRWLSEIARDFLGHQYHQDMLDRFCRARDYDGAQLLAEHLSQAGFDGYLYQRRAKNLAKQLPGRADDFKKLKLPTPEEWKEQQTKLKRTEQIRYLAARLRLLNCLPREKDGDIRYNEKQFSKPWGNGVEVINPFTQLQDLKLQVADLPQLVAFLADDSYMLVYSYLQVGHPNRTLHMVNWAVAELINDIATHDLAGLVEYNRLDDTGRKAHLDRILAWCKDNAGKSRDELLLATLGRTKSWDEFARAALELVEKKNAKALPIFIERMKTFTRQAGFIAEFCLRLDAPAAATPARDWVKSDDQAVRFWAALILLRQGDKSKLEGMEPLKAILSQDDGTRFYPQAIDVLLAHPSEEVKVLACAILKTPHFRYDPNRGEVLRRMFVAGRTEALEFVQAGLDSKEEAAPATGIYKGKEIQSSQTTADAFALDISEWRTDKWKYENLAPADEREAQRHDLKKWLKEQFARIKKGEKPDMRTENRPLRTPQTEEP